MNSRPEKEPRSMGRLSVEALLLGTVVSVTLLLLRAPVWTFYLGGVLLCRSSSSACRRWIPTRANAGAGTRSRNFGPGTDRDSGLLGLVPEDQQQNLLDALTGEVPLGRVADAAEVAAAALASRATSRALVNGSELFADGGQAQV